MPSLTDVLLVTFVFSIGAGSFPFLRCSAGRFSKSLNAFLSRTVSGRLVLTRTFVHEGSSGKSEKQVADYTNVIFSRIREIFKNVASMGFTLTTTSDSIKDGSGKMLDMAEKTSFQATQVATAMEEMSSTINEIARNAEVAAESSASMTENANRAGSDIKENVRSIELLSENVSHWAETNKALSKATEQIYGIISVIKDIADQTNLLALNAAIEAARAGEHGRGFAVVAEEVRKLADKTGKATQEIASMITEVKEKADNSLTTMDKTLERVNESIGRARSVDKSLETILAGVNQTGDLVRQIASAVEEQSKVSGDVLANMEEVSNYAKDTRGLALSISRSGDSIASHALALYGQLCGVIKDKTDENMETLLINSSAHLKNTLEDAIKGGWLANHDLFDEQYAGKGEGKLTTRSSAYFENEILPLLKKWAQAEKGIIYVVVMDRNGYMPTHIMPARAGVRMEDEISLKGAQSNAIIGQAFRRPIQAGGELVNDISHPVTIGGRHWGCLRIGYLPEV